MQVTRMRIEGLLVIEPDVFRDDRGCFFEHYNRDRYAKVGLEVDFIQDNCSYSRQGTVRGLHYQVGAGAQGKLTTVLYGRVLDVAVDVRFGSPTFGQHVAIELSRENALQFWLPPGFAHGFSVLSEEAVFSYKCTSLYSKPDERAILFSDPDLGIDWQVSDPIVSEKDLAAPRLCDIQKDYIYRGGPNPS